MQPITSTCENTTAESLEIDLENEQPLNTSATARRQNELQSTFPTTSPSTTFQTEK